MNLRGIAALGLIGLTAYCARPSTGISAAVGDYSSVSRVDSGRAVAVMLTAYSTTLRANGRDSTRLRVAVTDSLGREIRSAHDTIRVYAGAGGTILGADGEPLPLTVDSSGTEYAWTALRNGVAWLAFRAGTTPARVKVEARDGRLFPGGHEIHTIPADVQLMTPTIDQLPSTTKPIGRMIGADISWLPEIESGAGRFGRGPRRFSENGRPIDPIALLKEHGFNYVRLRLFVDPSEPKGYSPGAGFCGLDSTLSMARRVKAAGLKLLLDFHYSDYWADPQQQNTPAAWADLPYPALRDTLRSYTARVLATMKSQDVAPDMVQIGNEINHGILWPDGHIGNLDRLAGLLRAGVEGVAAVDSTLPVMMHLALGGQNSEARFWLDNMLARGVRFDLIGLSYYPRWHGTLEDLASNLRDLVARYRKPVDVVEYGEFARPVHEIVFGLPGEMGKGAAIWEPLNAGSGLFDDLGNVTGRISVYDSLSAEFLGRRSGTAGAGGDPRRQRAGFPSEPPTRP